MGDAAVAQNVRQADLEHCAGLVTAELKLACYEKLTATGSAEPAMTGVTSEATASPDAEVASTATAERDTSDTEKSPTALAAAAVAIVPDPEPTRSSPDTASRTPSSAVVGQGAVTTGVVAGSSGVKADSAAAMMTSSSVASGSASPAEGDVQSQDIPDDFGREHLDGKDASEKEASQVTATVIKVEERSNKVLYFYFENGQIWRQLEGRRFSYPRSGEFDVTINTGIMGDYRLRLEKGGPMTRIKRVQ